MDSKEKFKWETLKFEHLPVGNGDIRIVNLPVQVKFEWSDKIIADYDSETDTVLEYKSGYIMKVFPDQEFVYKNEESILIANSFTERNINL